MLHRIDYIDLHVYCIFSVPAFLAESMFIYISVLPSCDCIYVDSLHSSSAAVWLLCAVCDMRPDSAENGVVWDG